ncbi:MAG TPA: glycosyltransferase family 2 protein [Pyrinomonadaceae bacterium]
MSTSKMPVLVSIVSTNDGPWLTSCFDSLAAIREQIDVVVVANDCDDNTEEICAAAPLEITVLRTDTRLGFAACNNLSLHIALQKGYEYAFLLNPDTRIQADTVSSLVQFMRSHSEFGITGSIQFEYGDETWTQLNEWSCQTLDHAATLGAQQKSSDGFKWIEHYYVQGAALMLRLKLAERIGLLDPVYGTFYEETDLCRRCLLSGHKVAILLNSRVQHYGGGNWKSNLTKHHRRDLLMLRNRFLYAVSGAKSRASMAIETFRVLAHEIRTVLFHLDDVILPWWRYGHVLWSALRSVKDILQLYKRNQIIRSGALVPESLWAVGTDT